MLKRPWMLALPLIVLALGAGGPLIADEAPRPEAPPESLAPSAAPAVEATPAEAPEPAPVPIQPVPMSDCYSISFHAADFSACESGCYSQNCGINYFDPSTCTCYCGTKM